MCDLLSLGIVVLSIVALVGSLLVSGGRFSGLKHTKPGRAIVGADALPIAVALLLISEISGGGGIWIAVGVCR